MEQFSALLALCAGNSPVTGEFPAQRPVMRSFDVFFNLRLNKQSWGCWFETPSPSLWRHCNGLSTTKYWPCSVPKNCILWQSPVPPNDGKDGITTTLGYHCETFPFQLFLIRIRLHVFPSIYLHMGLMWPSTLFKQTTFHIVHKRYLQCIELIHRQTGRGIKLHFVVLITTLSTNCLLKHNLHDCNLNHYGLVIPWRHRP